MTRQDVSPKDGSAYSDIFWSSLYGTLCGFGFAEVRLIWMRYSAFLLAHSAFIGLIGRGTFENRAGLLAALAVVGLLLTWFWLAMNSLGWNNQNLWYWHAARLKFTGVTAPLPTDAFATDNVPKPFGAIFTVAQLVSALFVLAYGILLASALRSLQLGGVPSFLISGLAVLAVLGTAAYAHNAFYTTLASSVGNRPL